MSNPSTLFEAYTNNQCCGSASHDADPDTSYHSDADRDPDPHPDPDPTFHPDADPDPDPSFQIKAQTLKKCSNRLILHTFCHVICKLMRIRPRIRILIFIWCGCGFMWIRIWMWIRIKATASNMLRHDQSLWIWERPYAGEWGGVDNESAPPTLLQAHVLQGHLSPLHHRHLKDNKVLSPNLYGDADPDPDPNRHQNRYRSSYGFYPQNLVFRHVWKSEFFLLFCHSIASLQCFIFIISVKYVIIFKSFDSILKFPGKKFSLSTFSSAWSLIPIRIGMSWMPIQILIQIQIRQNDADPDPDSARWWEKE